MISMMAVSWPYIGLSAIVGSVVVAAIKLVVPIVKPKIISYPWQLSELEKEREKDKQLVVVLAGSYNPPHNGHLSMLKYLSSRYGQVIVVVGVNPNKKYLVSPDQRAKLLREFLSGLDNIRVEVVSGLIWRFVKRQGAAIFFRGIRSWEKDGEDERSLQILNTWGPLVLGPLWWPIPTWYLEGDPKYNHVSSTLIRDISNRENSSTKEMLVDLVPCQTASKVAELYSTNALKVS